MTHFQIATIPGDGIGPDVISAAQAVTDQALRHTGGVDLAYVHYDAGAVDNELSMLHFVSEHRIIELLSEAGFDGIAEFYRAFLFGGWFARKH